MKTYTLRGGRVGLALLVVVSAAVLCGCGKQTKVYPVTGKLTKGGQPLGDVTITFLPADGTLPASSGDVGADGSFQLTCDDGRPGAVAGAHKVILSVKMTEQDYDNADGPPEPPFPSEYGDKSTSPKEVQVTESENSITIEIQPTSGGSVTSETE